MDDMNSLQNGVNLIGRTGVTPIIRSFENGMKLAIFSIAINDFIYEVNGKRKETQWHAIVAWGKQADLCERFVKKGQMVAIKGKLVNRLYKDLGGMNRRVTEVQVRDIILINPQKAG